MLRGAELVQKAVDTGLVGETLHTEQLRGERVGPQLMIDVFGPGTTYGQRAEEGLEFL